MLNLARACLIDGVDSPLLLALRHAIVALSSAPRIMSELARVGIGLSQGVARLLGQ